MIFPSFFWKKLFLGNSFNFVQKRFLEKLNIYELYKFLKEDTSLNLIMFQIVKQLLINLILLEIDIDIDKISLELNYNLDLLNLLEADSTNEKMKSISYSINLNKD